MEQNSNQPIQNNQGYQNTQGGYQQPQQPQNNIPEAYKPVTAWGYVGWNLLFSIPIVGFIVALVFALGGTSNINRKKYAQSKFCEALLAIIIVLVVYFVFGFKFIPRYFAR